MSHVWCCFSCVVDTNKIDLEFGELIRIGTEEEGEEEDEEVVSELKGEDQRME